MVFDMHRTNKKKGNFTNSKYKSADGGVSGALRTCKKPSLKSPYIALDDLEEDHLDFEPEFEDGLENGIKDTSQNHSEVEESHICSDQSTVADLGLAYQNLDNYSESNLSIAHGREMLPLPHSDAEDGRQYQYLPVCYTPSSRTTLDSSSEADTDSDTEKIESDVPDSGYMLDQSSYQSSFENDENSVEYSLTQEEEDKLLDSDEEVSKSPSLDDSLIIQSDLVETCQIGNARITLPKFVNNTFSCQNNDLKRNKSWAGLRKFENKKKKKKWDLCFKPEHPHTRLYLNDIGYISDTDSDKTSNETVTDNPNVQKFIVICNGDKINCEELQGSTQRGITTSPKFDSHTFKLPLPPPKRPPTRPKRTVSNSDGPSANLQIKFCNKDPESPAPQRVTPFVAGRPTSVQNIKSQDTGTDKDDTLSIIASTIGGDNNDCVDTQNLSDFEEEDQKESRDPPNSAEDRVQEWVRNISHPSVTNTIKNVIGPKALTSPPPNQPSREEVLVMPSVSTQGNLRVHFRDVPNVFGGLCYHHYFNENCHNRRCNMAHLVTKSKLVHKLQGRSPQEVYKAFQFALRFENLIREAYPAFITAFGLLKMQNELVTCIKLFTQKSGIDFAEAVELIVVALEQSGLSFQEAVEMISFNIGFLEHPVLADILLDLITRKCNISENWEVIKRIARARGKIAPVVVKKLLSMAVNTYPVNNELCLDIYNVFIKNNMTDLSKISDDVLAPYKVLAGFRDAIPVQKKVLTKSPPAPIRSATISNPQEVLAAHIDNNLIRERQRYEREVHGTTVRASLTSSRVDKGPPFPPRGYNIYGMPTTDNRSPGSDTEDQFLFPPRPGSYPRMDYSGSGGGTYLGNAVFSGPSSNTSTNTVDLDNNSPNAVLNFEPPPPSDISEYVPTNIQKDVNKDQEKDVDIMTLTPSRPIFGRASYREGFTFKHSIHNLLPDSVENVNINEKDISKLNTVIKTRNGFEFCKLLEYYKDPPTVENFITMTIVHLKSSGDDIYNNLIELVKALELAKPDYAKDRHVKAIFEIVVMNLLLEFQKKGLWTCAKNLLELFCDWDSLISSKMFAKTNITHMGRYIFLAKIFANAKSFHFAYEILLCSRLKLLGSPDTWPYFRNPQVDLENRNAVLREFLKFGHQHYTIGVADLYRRNFKFGGIHGFDAYFYFNPMLIQLINEQQTSLLKFFTNDIDVYYKVMEKNVLRAFVIILASQFDQETLFRLYELCCERHIYTLFTGAESIVTVRNNMFDLELQLILSYYLFKMSQNRQLPPGSLLIQIKLLENKPVYPKMLQRCVRSIIEIHDKIIKILRDNFRIAVNESHAEQLTVIEVVHEQLEKWMRGKQRWFPIM